jgi:archaellum biogenesis ATPase FlaH
MIKKELIKRSPLRILEKSINGGVGGGNIAVIASPKGVGKTGCLVHIATDSLLQGKHVIHVSFSGRTDHIISWYEDIFKEIAKKKDFAGAMELHDEIIRNRVILNFNQDGVTITQIVKSLKAMIYDGNFAAEQIVVDGFDFSKITPEDFKTLKDFISSTKVSLWLSASLKLDSTGFDNRGVPESLLPFVDDISILITLEARKFHIALRLVKDHDLYPKEDLHLKLDPKSLLIAEE